MTKRILFVDDEPMVLSGLERSLHSMRREWEMVFVTGGLEALQSMEKKPFDIIVTDMRMPIMNGAQLLEEVKRRFPRCLRVILSGQANQDNILESVSPTHQYFSKPCEGDELRRRLVRAFAIRDLLQNQELRGLVAKLDSLPSLPSLYLDLTSELNKSEPSVARIGDLVSQDMAMTAKILQLVNSAFFGLRGRVSRASRAVELLGIDTIRALVLTTHLFSKFQTDLLSEADVQYLWAHSLAAGCYAKKIATMEKANQSIVDDCFTAAVLHDTGKLILAATAGDKYKEVLRLVKETGTGLEAAETAVLGCSHAAVGAYMFGLWGLPEHVIEGVAWHHNPSLSSESAFSTVTATHLASFYHEQQTPWWMQDKTSPDVEYLSKIDCVTREEEWRRSLLKAPSEVTDTP